MKTIYSSLFMAAALSAAAKAQTLGTAANYDIFVMNNGRIELKDSNQLYGQVGYSAGSDIVKNETMQNFEGAVYAHSSINYTPGTGFNPSGGVHTSGYDNALNQANTDLAAYMTHLDGLTADFSYTTKQQAAYSLTTTKALTVLNFAEIDMTGQNFSLTGRAGQSDQVIIRISNQLAFDGANVNLTNLNQRDVIWYYTNTGNFDLHRGGNNFYGTILAPNGKVIVGEANFTGAVYGTELVLGSGFVMEGNTVPEPSAALMLISGVGVLLLVRRRNH